MRFKDPAAWLDKKKLATALNYHIGSLLYDKGVELIFFRNPLNEVNTTEILRLHDYAEKVVGQSLDLAITVKIAEALRSLDLVPSKIDIGKLSAQWPKTGEKKNSLEEFLTKELSKFISEGVDENIRPVDVILYGFGRIGRLCARSIIEMTGIGAQLRLRAIVTRNNDPAQMRKRADLLRLDSVHGPFNGVISFDDEKRQMMVNGEKIQMIAASDPSNIDYQSYGIDHALVIDNTGVWRTKETLSQHLSSPGVAKVLLTAPGKEMPNVVYGVNHKQFTTADQNVWSAASCTTNAIVPVLKVVEDQLGIEKGHLETIHAYTNDQNLLDNMHKKHRRGRSAPINMVITETGAASAVSKVLPSLSNKLTGSAVRVPTPNGSLAILSLNLKRETSIHEVNEIMRKAALEGPLRNQIKYSIESELVSTDIISEACCSVFDSPSVKISSDQKSIVLYVWYDNEYGYTQQVIRLSKYVMDAQRKIYD